MDVSRVSLRRYAIVICVKMTCRARSVMHFAAQAQWFERSAVYCAVPLGLAFGESCFWGVGCGRAIGICISGCGIGEVIAIQFHPNERFGVPGAPAGGGVPAGSHPCWETGYVRLDYLPASITLRIEAWGCS